MKHIFSDKSAMRRMAGMCLAISVASTCAVQAQADDAATPEKYYLVHSGGAHVGCAADGRAVLESQYASSPTMLTFTPSENGFFTISADDGGYLSLSGKWDTFFTSTAAGSDSEFSIEQTGDGFVRLRCRGNGKYLGTDSGSEGSYVYCDKSGSSPLHYWYLSETPEFDPPVAETAYVVNPYAERQRFDGWGVSLCWWANMCGRWSDEKIDEIVDWLVSPEGLNFRIFRYNIGGGDDPANGGCTPHHMGEGKGLRAEMEGFKDSSDGPYVWSRDEAQRKIMLKIKEKRPDAIFEAFSNSCPWYMTYSGCVAGNKNASQDNLRPEYYEEFAHYLVDVCRHYKDEYGIEFRTLDPFNEPETNYWGANGGQEGCHFSPQSQIAFLKVLHPILKASGLSTVISASDETSVAQSVKDFEAYRDAGILDMVGQWNTHTYSADNKSRARISALCKEHSMPLWMSEVGVGGSGIDGNLELACKLIDDMRYIMPSAWVDWQYVEEGNDQWCLVEGNFADQSYHKVKNYYVRSHFSRYIKEGYTMLSTLAPRTLAARSPEGDRLVVVAVNTGASEEEHRLDLSMYKSVAGVAEAVITDRTRDMADYNDYDLADGTLTYWLPSASVATIVLDVVAPDAPQAGVHDGAMYLVTPRMACDMAVDATDGKVALAKAEMTASRLWTLDSDGEGYTMTNGSGDILTASDGYALGTSREKGVGQVFTVVPVDDVYFRISEPSGDRAFDLEGEHTSAGTAVGLWSYVSGGAPVHRQWQLVEVPASLADSGVERTGDDAGSRLFRISGASPGELSVTYAGESRCTLRIYTAGGTLVYDNTLETNAVSVALPSGCYLVSASDASGAHSACLVMVR